MGNVNVTIEVSDGDYRASHLIREDATIGDFCTVIAQLEKMKKLFLAKVEELEVQVEQTTAQQ